MNWQEQLITLYLLVCKYYQNGLSNYCRRTSNYANLEFSDEEVITIYIFGIMQKRRTQKEIYCYAKDHFGDWFPKLPCYEAFVYRIDRIADVFPAFIEALQNSHGTNLSENVFNLIDSMPIVMAKMGRRFSAKVAREIATPNGYCATKKMYYYGVKLHILAKKRDAALPEPIFIGITDAGTPDIKALEAILNSARNMTIFADKAYISSEYRDDTIKIFTPIKKEKKQEFLDAADQLYSTAVSRIRQPIESLFNWIEEKVSIQVASKVRSSKGLLVHVFGRLTAAIIMLLKPCFSF